MPHSRINIRLSFNLNFISWFSAVFLYPIHQHFTIMTTKTGILALLMTFGTFYSQAKKKTHFVHTTETPIPIDAALHTKAPTVIHSSKSHMIKVALLLDTSNSMDGLIDQAKAQLWELVNELSYAKCADDAKPSLEIALYEYGNDGLNAREGNIGKVLPFSDALAGFSKN